MGDAGHGFGRGAFTLLATIIAQRVQAERERRHRQEDTRIEFQRQALLELQDELEALLASSLDILICIQDKNPVTAESRRSHVKVASRVWVLAARVDDLSVCNAAKSAAGLANPLADADNPEAAFAAFAGISRQFHQANDRIEQIIRGGLVVKQVPPGQWWRQIGRSASFVRPDPPQL